MLDDVGREVYRKQFDHVCLKIECRAIITLLQDKAAQVKDAL